MFDFRFQWNDVKEVFSQQMKQAMDTFIKDESLNDKPVNLPNVENITNDEMKDRILVKFRAFTR